MPSRWSYKRLRLTAKLYIDLLLDLWTWNEYGHYNQYRKMFMQVEQQNKWNLKPNNLKSESQFVLHMLNAEYTWLHYNKSIKRVFILIRKQHFLQLTDCMPACSHKEHRTKLLFIIENQQPNDMCFMRNKIYNRNYWPMSEVRKWNCAYMLPHLYSYSHLQISSNEFRQHMNRTSTKRNQILSGIRNNNRLCAVYWIYNSKSI